MGSARALDGLYSAEALPAKPDCIPSHRIRGVALEGLRFEKAVFASLAALAPQRGRWFRFVDRNGRGFCAPDILLLDLGVVVECKLTYTERAQGQLRDLYLPVVGRALSMSLRGIVICRNLRRGEIPAVYDSLRGALQAPSNCVCPVVHWLGKGPLV